MLQLLPTRVFGALLNYAADVLKFFIIISTFFRHDDIRGPIAQKKQNNNTINRTRWSFVHFIGARRRLWAPSRQLSM